MLPAMMNRREYEYTLKIVTDKANGAADIATISSVIEKLSQEGWRLVTVFTNEVGKISESFGGFGTNATIDQTILIFERKIHVESILDRERRIEIPIKSTNEMGEIVPKTITFVMKGSELSAILKVYCKRSYELKGLQCDLVVYNIFGDETVLKDVCFFSFEKDADGYFISDAFPVQLPDKISRGLDSAGIIMTRFIGSDGLQISDQKELLDIGKIKKENAGEFDEEKFMSDVIAMKSTLEIYHRMQEIAEELPDVFTDEIITEIGKTAKYERMYGNMKKTAITKLNAYFDGKF